MIGMAGDRTIATVAPLVPTIPPRRSNGVEILTAAPSSWPGLTRFVLQLRWLTEPGWIEFAFDRPACLVVVEEIGGRCDLRPAPERFPDNAFVGLDHVSLVSTGTPVTIHADEIRRATLICCLAGDSAERDDEEALTAIGAAPTRLMARDRLLHDCAVLFGRPDVRDSAEPFAGAVAHAVLMAWAAATARKAWSSPANNLRGKRLRDVLAYIRDELDEPISIAALAERAGLTTAGFSKQFEEVTGLTPQAWQMETRVRNAQRLMIDDPKGSLDEFAALCGFADQSHFSRVFLKVIGMSPTEWLRRQT